MAGEFAGRSVIVTGGGAGMGRAACLAFAREGAQVTVADVDVASGEETARLIQQAGGVVQFVRTDVSRAEEVEALITAAVAVYGRLDCAFNNAGIHIERGPLTELTEEQWDRIIGVNLKGVFLCMKYEIPALRRARGAAVVNNASVVGLSGSRGSPAYVASKHGIVGLTRAAARDHAAEGIRVNAVCPGSIQTPMYVRREGSDAEHDARLAASIPLGRLGQPQDVAEAVLWLCSERASFVTGHALVVDGGDTV